MKKSFLIIIYLMLSLSFSCNEKDNSINDGVKEKLIGEEWENSDLDFIGFDTTFFYLPIKEMSPIVGAFEYSISNDTLRVINKIVDGYNLVDYEDTISEVRFKYIHMDSFEIELLNSGAEELFKSISNLTFYNSKTIDRFSYYNEKDSICRIRVDSALFQVQHGKFSACIHSFWRFRQEEEFKDLLNKYGIRYLDLGPPSDVLPVKRNCYCETMNYLLEKNYGEDFIRKTMAKADTAMVENLNDKYIDSYLCDKEPLRPGTHYGGSQEVYIKVDLPIKERRKEWYSNRGEEMFAVYHPFMDIEFQNGKDGNIFNFHLNNFIPELEWNEQFRDSLFAIGVLELKENPIWRPCEVLGRKIASRHTVRVSFEN